MKKTESMQTIVGTWFIHQSDGGGHKWGTVTAEVGPGAYLVEFHGSHVAVCGIERRVIPAFSRFEDQYGMAGWRFFPTKAEVLQIVNRRSRI